jgi:hypothetical protein
MLDTKSIDSNSINNLRTMRKTRIKSLGSHSLNNKNKNHDIIDENGAIIHIPNLSYLQKLIKLKSLPISTSLDSNTDNNIDNNMYNHHYPSSKPLISHAVLNSILFSKNSMRTDFSHIR